MKYETYFKVASQIIIILDIYLICVTPRSVNGVLIASYRYQGVK